MSFIGLLVISLLVFFFLTKSAEMQSDSVSSEQNLALGKLAFTSRLAGPTAPDGRVIITNPDGSGGIGLPIPTSLSPTEPAWSPDATKMAFVSTQNPGDIWVINTDGSGQTNLTNTAEPIRESNPSWSVTGKIAYERSFQIWIMNADGSGQAQFPGITQPSSGPAWSPDGTKLAFSSNDDIWVINADGTNAHRVTTGATSETDPAWSPDGSKLVYAKSGAGITVINADGTNETPLSGVSGDSRPTWSPDGTKIAFTRNGIVTMDANGANQVRIAANFTNFPLCCDTIYENPAWQPVAQTPNTYTISGRVTYNNLPVIGVTVNLSGTTNAAVMTDAVGNYQFSELPAGGNYTVSPSFPRYYFTPPNRSFNNLASNQTGNNFEVLGICQGGRCAKNGKIAFTRSGEILTINSDGTAQTNITNNAATDDEPNWSPDGANIIFATGRDGNAEIYRMNADGGNPVRLTNNAASDTSPYYSPDGASIVFVSTRDGNNEIYKMNADGSNQVRLTNNTTPDFAPAFSPDGQKIIFVNSTQMSPNKFFTINADGSNQQQIPGPVGFSAFYSRPSYSPDGSKIIFTYTPDASTQVSSTWTMNADGTNATMFPAGGSSGTYSPDGAYVTYTCCQINNTYRLYTANANGSSGSVRNLTPLSTGNSSPDWQPLPAPRPAPFDFDGDGRSDQSIFRPGTGDWWYLSSSSNEQRAVHWGLSDDVLAPADYDGDLKTDAAVWRASDGNFYILNSFDNTIRIENFGFSGDVPTGGDWDADGKADLAVYRGGAQGTFYYRGSMGNPQSNITVIPWGISGDKPVAGDYDGDGRADAAIYRSGVWWIRQSSNGQSSATNYGLADDVLVPADYDADGKTDLAVYRGGVWYILRSAQGSVAFQYGLSKDTPAPADYDGDGRADAAIYRNGAWWILKTQSGTSEVVSFGLSSDKPIPSAYVRNTIN
jgi:Tol biopolymer transport system component